MTNCRSAPIARGEARTLSVSAEGLWLRQGNGAQGQTVIHASLRANGNGTVLSEDELFRL